MAGFDHIPGVNSDYDFPLLVRNALKEYLVAQDTTDFVVYAHGDGVEIVVPFSQFALVNTIAHRHEDGALTVGEPVDTDDAVTKAYADAIVPPWIVLGPADPIPGGTPADTIIFRTAA